MDPFDLKEWKEFDKADAYIDQVVIDSRLIQSKHALFVALKGERDGHDFVRDAYQKGAKYAIVKKTFQSDFPNDFLIRVDDPLRALQQIAALYRSKKKAVVVGITGSKGKTMVKDFLASLLSHKKRVVASPESFNSQLGVALSLLQIREGHEIALIEAGISEQGEMDHLSFMVQPDHAILTVIEESHHPKEVVAHEKSKLLKSVKEGWILAPKELPELSKRQFHWNGDLLPQAKALPSKDPFILDYQVIFPSGKEAQLQFKRPFKYALDLINIGIKAAHLLNLSEEEIIFALQHSETELMQTEIWKASNGPTYINEPYSADMMSIITGLKRLNTYAKGRKFFDFGGLRHREMTEAEKEKLQATLEDYNIKLLKANDLTEDDTILIQGPNKKPLDELNVAYSRLTINLSAIEANIQKIKTSMPQVKKVMAMVKADGYGTNSIILAKFLKKCGVHILGVAYPDEAIRLKKNGVLQSIFVLHAALFEIKKIVDYQFEVAVSSLDFVQALAKEAEVQNKIIKVHLHIDTGMSRLGCRREHCLDLARFISTCPLLQFEGVMTHFACADMEEEDAFTLSQVEKFRSCLHLLEKHSLKPFWVHIANSSGALRGLFPEGNLIRLGLALFGLTGPLQLAVHLTSRIVGINHCKKGDSISYGRLYTVQNEEERIAVVPLGYFDGLHRHYSGKASVLIRGQEAPIVGRICMDFFMCNITHILEATLGDPVLIFGEDAAGNTLLPTTLAAQGATNTHELLTCLGPRIQRLFIEHDH